MAGGEGAEVQKEMHRSTFERGWRIASGSVWIILSVATGALAVASLIVRSFGVELSEPNEGVLQQYRLFIGRLFYFAVEWWSALRIPEWMQDYLSVHAIFAATDIRLHIKRGNPKVNVMTTVISLYPGTPTPKAQVESQRRQGAWRDYLSSAVRGPLCAADWLKRLSAHLRDIRNAARARPGRGRKQRLKQLWSEFGATFFWIAATPIAVVAFFLKNALGL